MSKNIISISELEDWKVNNFTVYCAETITHRRNTSKRLTFEMNSNGEYKVMSGYEEIYLGDDFQKAKEHYESQGE